ncbi:uncharacterized protein BDR25DRAFT_24569 [Lindgomyces ingoldianus]|uniref:Uncharacterized protein n=1 Tax=Lindgomyces ingoldianus TaxID=673940 RepID=A0ACB6QYJ7_9PLEO|nr:uncharacterized protein BDR25DRAFT_24569 [Lindgomyces ingoldianus]KAF2471172.1 hypothetical protein BDR25DRAFT_24569 [Lindgomyces ingoldianus]
MSSRLSISRRSLSSLPLSVQFMLKALTQPFKRTQQYPSCSLLSLPRELRDQIFKYLLPVHTYASTAVPFQPPGNSGFLFFYGTPPPTELLLINHQIGNEIRDHFFRTTTFQIGDLTPYHESFHFDPVYKKLRASERLSQVRSLQVRFHLAQMVLMDPANPTTATDLGADGLGICIRSVEGRAWHLARTLSNRARALRTLTIVWEDDFGEDDEDWKLKMRVLVPIAKLVKADVRFHCFKDQYNRRQTELERGWKRVSRT